MREKLLSVEGVSHKYPGSDWQLSETSFSVRRGEIVGIVGPNGSGKSTLLKVAAGVIRPGSGEVLLLGRNIARLKRREIARNLGYFPQNDVSGFDYSVHEVVAMGRFCRLSGAGFLSSNDMAVIEKCLLQTGTQHYRQRLLSRLSGGERQRVLLASVLAQEPEVLLLDEPSRGLDLHHQVRFFRLLGKLVAGGMGVAVVTHELNLASCYSDRLLLLKEGKITHEGKPEEIINENILKETYGDGVDVIRHPITGRPIVLPEGVVGRTATG
ncbi:MAG: ABC transporter ATP-binding protein [Deltaproteobacteria bacterium]|nr:ABC transporter ATP-binding protein [Deltaproteobacteria bacterium]